MRGNALQTHREILPARCGYREAGMRTERFPWMPKQELRPDGGKQNAIPRSLQ